MNSFIKTLKYMQECGEFDRIFNSLKNPKDYEIAKQMTRKQRREGMIECQRLKAVDYSQKEITIPLMNYISNELIWRDIVCLMIRDEESEKAGAKVKRVRKTAKAETESK